MICLQRIEHPGAWTSRDLVDNSVDNCRGKDALTLRLTGRQLDAIDALLERTRHLQPQQVTREDFTHPDIDALMLQVRDVIMNGRGVVVLRGVTPERYGVDTAETFERIYWGLGTHLGTGAVQSAAGDRLGYVQNTVGDQVNRGYRSLRELHMHTDAYEIVGLMSVRAAKSGGLSGLVSSLAIHNAILDARPDLLPPLYRGFNQSSEEARKSSKPVTDLALPVFSYVDGLVSCNYEPAHMKAAAVQMQVPFPADLAEAVDYFDELANSDDLALRFLLEPGEMMLWHNFTNLHSRTAFEDFPDRKRLLLRLWLTPEQRRPQHPTMRVRAETYERIHREARSRGS